MTIDKEAKLCWSLCTAARQGWPNAESMFRASMLHAETKSERIRKALENAFDTQRLALMIGDNMLAPRPPSRSGKRGAVG